MSFLRISPSLLPLPQPWSSLVQTSLVVPLKPLVCEGDRRCVRETDGA